VVALVAERPTCPLIEIPDTPEGWDDVAHELAARLAALAQAPPLRLVCAIGEFTVLPRVYYRTDGGPARDSDCVLTSEGHMSLGWSRYTVYGNPHRVDVQTGDAGCGRAATRGRAARVREAIAPVWLGDGEHAELREMHLAYKAAVDYGRSYARDPHRGGNLLVEAYLADGQRALLRLAVINRLRGKARAAARVLIENGYVGPVQDLLDAAHAVTAGQLSAP